MAAVVATDEWPRRSLTVAMSTPLSSRRDAWLWRTVWRLAPLGSLSVRQSLETVPDTDSGFSGVPSGLAMIRSRSARRRAARPGNRPDYAFSGVIPRRRGVPRARAAAGGAARYTGFQRVIEADQLSSIESLSTWRRRRRSEVEQVPDRHSQILRHLSQHFETRSVDPPLNEAEEVHTDPDQLRKLFLRELSFLADGA